MLIKNPLSRNLIASWHPTKNFPLEASSVNAGSNKSAWWVCDKGHEWEAVIYNRATKSVGCPYCSNRKVLAGFNDLATTHPDLVESWHPTKNGILSPQKVIAGSAKKIWWVCDKGHEWENSLGNRIRAKHCPICTNKVILEGYNDLKTLNPTLAKDWHPTKNRVLPTEVSKNSGKLAWWLCEKGHEWEAVIGSRSVGNGCPYCANYKVLTGFNDLATLSPSLSSEWRPTKNAPLTPNIVPAGTAKKVWWQCDKGHEWEAKVESRYHKITGCPYCSNNKLLIGFNDLATKHPHLIDSWHPILNLPLTPHTVITGSNKKLWWACDKGHEWQTIVTKRIGGTGCPICANKKVLAGFNDVATVHPSLIPQWHPIKNGYMTPENVIAGSGKRIWWQCDKGHEWETGLNNRVYGKGCPSCAAGINVSRGEKEVSAYIKSLGFNIETSVKSIIKGELDIYVPERKIAVEFNGLYWHNENFVSNTYHQEKYDKCKTKGIQLIQIWADDWENKPLIVKQVLYERLNSSNNKKVEDKQHVIEQISAIVADEYLEKNHLHGRSLGSIYLGIRDVKEKTLNAVMVLSKDKENILILQRFAANKNLMNNFEKLLTHVINLYTPDSVIGFSDNIMSEDFLFSENGFKLVEVAPPDYIYVSRNRKIYKEELVESELANLNDLNRIWDAGKTKFRLNLDR